MVFQSCSTGANDGTDSSEEVTYDQIQREEETKSLTEEEHLLAELENAMAEAMRITPKFEYAPGLNPVGLDNVQAIYYTGMPYGSKPETRVFAYIGLPEGATAESPVPAVVCVHGGGGKAYPQWVKEWTNRGYAAIAMDTYGKAPTQPETFPYQADYTTRLADGGPNRDDMRTSENPLNTQWMYHAVTQTILAANLLRSLPQVQEETVGITGISWGAHITMNVISFDQRFAFAIPVYGSAYLPDSEGLFSLNFASTKTRLLWDPTTRLVRENKVPILLMNGDRDTHFSVNATQKTYETIDNTTILIRSAYSHKHTEGWSKPEIYVYADSICKSGPPLATVKSPSSAVTSPGSSGTLEMAFPEVTTYMTATLYYMNTPELPYNLKDSNPWKGSWYSEKLTCDKNTGLIQYTVPANATRFYILVVYTYNNTLYMVSSPLYSVD